MQSFVRVFHVETVSRSVERRGELQKLRNAVPKTIRNTKLSGVFVYLNPGRKKDAMTKRQPSRMTLSSTCQLLNYFHTDNEKENKPCVVKLFK